MLSVKLDLNNIFIHVFSDSERIISYISKQLNKFVIHEMGDESINLFYKKIKVYILNSPINVETQFDKKQTIQHDQIIDIYDNDLIKLITNHNSLFNINIDNLYIYFNNFNSFLNNHILYYIFRSFLSEIIKDKEYCFLHASCVQYNNKNIAFCGPGNSGKTSMLIRMLNEEKVKFLSNNLLAIDNELNCFGFPINPSVKVGTCRDFPELKNLFLHHDYYDNIDYLSSADLLNLPGEILNISNYYNKKKTIFNKPFKLDEIYLLNWQFNSTEDTTNIKDYYNENLLDGYFKVQTYYYNKNINLDQNKLFFKKYIINKIPVKIVSGEMNLDYLASTIL